jgi:hypothetical protein
MLKKRLKSPLRQLAELVAAKPKDLPIAPLPPSPPRTNELYEDKVEFFLQRRGKWTPHLSQS